MELTNDNYFSKEARMEYMGYSQFKGFVTCASKEMAKINEKYEEEKTQALLMGSYVDAYFSEEMEDFRHKNPDIFKKDGTLKSEYMQCDKIIEFIKKDPNFYKYLQGKHQVIMTGVIAGVKFKIKVDVLHDSVIVDQKLMKDLNPVWSDEYHCYMNFVDYYHYDWEGAIYREIVRQNTGKTLPFVLHVTTKEKVPSKALIRIDDEDLDVALKLVEELAPIFDHYKHSIKLTDEEMKILDSHQIRLECGECDWCKQNKMVTGIFSYHTLDPEERR